jgi:hypothetical protein
MRSVCFQYNYPAMEAANGLLLSASGLELLICVGLFYVSARALKQVFDSFCSNRFMSLLRSFEAIVQVIGIYAIIQRLHNLKPTIPFLFRNGPVGRYFGMCADQKSFVLYTMYA